MQLFRSTIPTKSNYDNAQFAGQDLLRLFGHLRQLHRVSLDPLAVERQLSALITHNPLYTFVCLLFRYVTISDFAVENR